MASQLYSVTGKKIPTDYTAIINAQTPYLPAYKKQAQDDAYRMKTLDLQEKALTQNEEMATEQLEQQKKQNRISNLLGVGNLGLKAGLGMYADKGNTTKDVVGNLTSPTIAKPTADMTNYLTAPTAGGVGTGTSVVDKLTDMGAWGNAATSYEPWAGGAGGALASRLLTKKDDSALKKGLIGAGAGAGIAAIVSGGDIYKSVLGGVLGGAGGLF
jgi:hypothetical protein